MNKALDKSYGGEDDSKWELQVQVSLPKKHYTVPKALVKACEGMFHIDYKVMPGKCGLWLVFIFCFDVHL